MSIYFLCVLYMFGHLDLTLLGDPRVAPSVKIVKNLKMYQLIYVHV